MHFSLRDNNAALALPTEVRCALILLLFNNLWKGFNRSVPNSSFHSKYTALFSSGALNLLVNLVIHNPTLMAAINKNGLASSIQFNLRTFWLLVNRSRRV